MSNTPTSGAFRTERLWAAAGVLFVVLLATSGWSWLTSSEFDEHCARGMVEGPGRLLGFRRQTFPPAVICEYEHGEVSAGGTGFFGVVMWICLMGMALCVVLALLAECVELPAGAASAQRISRTEKLRRTGTALFVTASAFLLVYGLAAWPLVTGPSSACSARGEWGTYPPSTVEYSLFPPQATCMYRSGETSKLNPGWVEVVTTALFVPMAISGVGVALALRRRQADVSVRTNRSY
ncbi:hypothetical protein OG883_15985 [Streptomyces sp. NBC_01142]|uniref:hypothetical protein n=1 Tax=Streptomyces sp. NBC_01142 TaxID=2975865 RepID=UPI002250C780|nr:hypothetical protein [Streptomyces sp. NBC_01142]MCX4821377.1 hypothetical protein [Streptomyces sp. NBC_01142]